MTSLGTQWRKPSRSDDHGNCVELRDLDGRVEMRDSKDPAGPVLRFDRDGFAAFVEDVKAGLHAAGVGV